MDYVCGEGGGMVEWSCWTCCPLSPYELTETQRTIDTGSCSQRPMQRGSAVLNSGLGCRQLV